MPRNVVNVTEPKFLAQVEKDLKSTPVAQWKTCLEGHILNAAADTLSKPFVEQNFAFNGKFLTGATEIKPRWKRCAEATDQQLGEALGADRADAVLEQPARTVLRQRLRVEAPRFERLEAVARSARSALRGSARRMVQSGGQRAVRALRLASGSTCYVAALPIHVAATRPTSASTASSSGRIGS
jgi:hypothetical protein